jgi:sarcosine oxidase subunit alpha
MAALTAGRAGCGSSRREDFCSAAVFLSGSPLTASQQDGRGGARRLASLDNVTIMPRTTIFGVYDGGTYGAAERVADDVPVPTDHQPRQRSWHIAAKRAVLASGAIERSIAFAGNDLPGVMLGSAVRSYLNRFGVAPGARAVVFTASDDGWATARDLAAAASRCSRGRSAARASSRRAGPWPVFAGAVVKEARGGQQLKSVIVRDDKGVETEIACDLLVVSMAGIHPASDLPSRRQACLAESCRLRPRVEAKGHGRGRCRGRTSLPC